jgi:hypothetical protein
MFAKIEHRLSLGGHYVAAAVIYLGLALILGGSTLLDSWQALAEEATKTCTHIVYVPAEGGSVPVTVEGCPEGQHCCDGVCISDEEICCEDGTHGHPDSGSCCGGGCNTVMVGEMETCEHIPTTFVPYEQNEE